MSPRRDLPRIKLDLTNDEILVLKPELREMHHPYSDRLEEGIHVQCYSFEELFAEKIRALAERLRPRDLYDVIHLYRHYGNHRNRVLVLSTLKTKCEFKNIPVPTVESLENRPERAELVTEWENMLGHQLPMLPPFDQFWNELPAIFEWLYRAVEKAPPSPMPLMGASVDETWSPPLMAHAWHAAAPLEVVRFAAANRLCVDLTYAGTRRIIEPYSLRRTREGNLLLYAVKHGTGEDRSYRVDRIQGASATKTPFSPRYVVELAASGPLSIQPSIRGGIGSTGYKSPETGEINRYSGSPASSLGPKYVFQCSLCGRQFTHKSYDASINSHKNKQGYPCPGRYGVYITTKN